MASKQDNPSLVAGIQLAQKREAVKGGDGFPSIGPRDMKEDTVEKEMQIDFKKPLQDAIKNIFDHCGKVVLAFPYSTQAQVKGFVDYIRNAVTTSHCKLQEQTRTTTCFSMCSRTEQVAEEFDECPDIDVELVGVTISRPILLIQLSQLIDEIIHKFRNLPNPRNPTVDVVILFDPSETQALKVRTGEVQTGQVYFESIDPESALDPHLFFRVQFFSTERGRERDFVTIWISVKTLDPIGITTNNELFAVLPQSTIFPAVCPSPSVIIDESLPADTDPFSWLQEILNQPNKYFFREASIGGDVIVIHPANATINRRVTRQEEIAIVADNNQWEFTVLKFTVTNS